ncbi:VOC family protein [Phenylobacterium montanum]|uniref:VOC family protein n=1 Tax=Phenylobacterium montanum TaxID=2823693 RepID=A0A975FZD1_9CAUL|nr:VOC family protein [Caulobacter sp. S6]QUD87951.1 VOC family protein [Caulobacter sp. S6]
MADADFGAPPKGGWAPMVAELLVTDIGASLRFWREVLGFSIAYQRPDEGFAYLERPEGAQVMLHQRCGVWETGPMAAPFGRGVMFQVYADDLGSVEAAIARAGVPLHAGPREVWRRHGDREGGQREVFVLDPDGYLVMVAQTLGQRPLQQQA